MASPRESVTLETHWTRFAEANGSDCLERTLLLRLPKYRHQKCRGRAFVEIAGRRTYLGKYGSEESHRRYAEILRDLKSHKAKAAVIPTDRSKLLIEDLVLAYWEQEVVVYYVKKTGKPTSEQARLRSSLRCLINAFGSRPAGSLDSLMLESVRDDMVKSGKLCVKTINGYLSNIKRLYKWAARKKLVAASVWHELLTVEGVKAGRTTARVSEDVPPIDDATIAKTLRHLSPVVRAMVLFQRRTGCRPGEVCLLRPCDIEGRPPAAGETAPIIRTPEAARTWCYRPHDHKTEHFGLDRRVYIGPKAQVLLRKWLDRPAESYCFNPREAVRSKKPGPMGTRKERAQPRPGRRGHCYTTASYRVAIHRACERAFGMPVHLRQISKKLSKEEQKKLRAEAAAWRAEHCWNPNQIRHTVAGAVEAEFGLVGVQRVLGHRHAKTSEIYARRDAAESASIMAKMG